MYGWGTFQEGAPAYYAMHPTRVYYTMHPTAQAMIGTINARGGGGCSYRATPSPE